MQLNTNGIINGVAKNMKDMNFSDVSLIKIGKLCGNTFT